MANFFHFFEKFFAKYPKVPAEPAVKVREGSRGGGKNFQKYFPNTLKFSATLPLKSQKGREQG